MDFDTFLHQGWNDHDTEPDTVFARCADATGLVKQPGQLAALGILAAHVSGEHLGRWADGAAFLRTLLAHPAGETDDAAVRQLHLSKAALHLASGDPEAAERELTAAASPEHDGASPRVRMLATTAAALAGRGRTTEAMALFAGALELAAYDPPASDPAARALAVTGNNLAVELEQREDRDAAATELMKTAAATARTSHGTNDDGSAATGGDCSMRGRRGWAAGGAVAERQRGSGPAMGRYWERVGTWVNVKIAEVRLAHTHLAAGEADVALSHARAALSICNVQDAPDAHRFYPWVAEARALHALGKRAPAVAAGRQAEQALAGMDPSEWPGARADHDALRTALGTGLDLAGGSDR